MSYISNAVEYALHCLLYLVDTKDASTGVSTRDLADLQGISPEYLAKIFTKLHEAGLVVGTEGARGGFALGRAAEKISVLDVVVAIDGRKPLFDCKEIRLGCAVFGTAAPRWASRGVCSIHAVMLEAEARMRTVLASHTLASISARVSAKAPAGFADDVSAWLAARTPTHRRQNRRSRTGRTR